MDIDTLYSIVIILFMVLSVWKRLKGEINDAIYYIAMAATLAAINAK